MRDPNDTTAPVASLVPGLNGAILTTLTGIDGTVSSSNLDYWTLGLAPLGSSTFTQIAGGNAPVSSVVLASLDPTTLANGPYQLQLTAADISGRVTTVTDTIEIDTAAKSTQYLTSATDLTVQLGGATISLVRQYDSLEANQSGTFGYGWRLANTDVDIQTDVPPTGLESSGIYNPFQVGTRLYLTLPNGARAGFTFTPTQHQQSGLIYYTPDWTADPGVSYTLSSASAVLVMAGNRLYDLKTAQPYNPASGDWGSTQYTLTGPDGTVYDISAQQGVQEEVLPGGVTLTFSDSGIVSSTGQAISFVHDSKGRLTAVTAPDGTRVLYTYDANGNLATVRNVALGQSSRFGYTGANDHLLDMVVQPGGPSSVITYSPAPTVLPLTADLGVSGQFEPSTTMGSLAASGTDRYSFTFTAADLRGIASGTVYLGVVVQAASGSNFQPAIPQIPGLTPRLSSSGTGTAFAIFGISQTGLEQLTVNGANATTSGAYSLHLYVAGDVNGDGVVDGNDAQLLTQALGTSAGQPGYVAAANFDQSGVIDATDEALLAADLGFAASKPPTVNPVQATTHQDLAVTINLSQYASDPQGNPLYFKIVGAQNGTATLGIDGQTATFLPAPGYTGPAQFQFLADDGSGTSPVDTVSITVSSAALTNLDFVARNPRIQPGDVVNIGVTGDFTDQSGALLPASYVTFQSSNPAVFTVSPQGQLNAVGDGTAVLLVSSHGIQAATAVLVGPPTFAQRQLYDSGLTTSLTAETLAANIGSHQLDVSVGQTSLTLASTGTLYFSSNPQVVTVSPDGVVSAGNIGTATVTVINGPAEEVVPVNVVAPSQGPVTIGADGAVVEGSDGSLVMIAPGAAPVGTTASIAPISESSLPMAPPTETNYLGAFNLDFGGQTLAHPVQLVIPAPAGAVVGQEVYFYRAATRPDASGNPVPVWIQSEIGVVKLDGTVLNIHTTSINGIDYGGFYTYGWGDLYPVYGYGSIAVEYDPATEFGVFGGDFGIFCDPFAFVIYLPVDQGQVTMEAIPPVGPVTLTPITISVNPNGTNKITPMINTPAFSMAPPEIDSLSLDTSTETLTLTGQHFGNGSDKVNVVFQVGGADQNGTLSGGQDITVAAQSVSATTVTVVVPNTFALGTASIYVSRNVDGLGKDVRESNHVRYPATANYLFTAQGYTGLAAIDDRETIPDPNNPGSTIANPNLNQFIAEVQIDGGSVATRYVAATPDNTRAYVTTFNGVIDIVDALTFQQIGLDNGQSGMDIKLPPAANPFEIVIDPQGQYAYVTDYSSPAVYIIDVNPEDSKYNTFVGTITVPSLGAGLGLRGLDINADGTRLFVAQPNRGDATFSSEQSPNSDILDIDLNPSDKTFQQVIATIPTEQDTYGIKATADPKVMLFTNALADGSGFGILNGAESSSPTATTTSLAFQDFNAENPFAVRSALQIAVTPDGMWAFVAAFNFPDYDFPSGSHGEPANNPAGSNVGIIKFASPYTDPQVVAATRSIPVGFTEDLRLSPTDSTCTPPTPSMASSCMVFKPSRTR